MGQDLTYTAGKASYEYRISRADWQLINSLLSHLPVEVGLLFTVPTLGSKVRVATVELRRAADRLTTFLKENLRLLPYTFQFKCDGPIDAHENPDTFGTGGMSGLRLPTDADHFYYIEAGLNECWLEKWAVGDNGKGRLTERRDIRELRELQTENLGKILIRRVRAKSDLQKALGEIRLFLQDVTEAEVTKEII